MDNTNAERPRREGFTTACGRRIRIGEFRVGTGPGTCSRVTLDVGPEPGGESRAWAGLTPDEARALAALLLWQATRAEAEGAAAPTGAAPANGTLGAEAGSAYSARWQTASTLLPSGSRTKTP